MNFLFIYLFNSIYAWGKISQEEKKSIKVWI